MSKRTWFKHRCWFCGRASRDVVRLLSEPNIRYQCTERPACRARHDARLLVIGAELVRRS